MKKKYLSATCFNISSSFSCKRYCVGSEENIELNKKLNDRRTNLTINSICLSILMAMSQKQSGKE